MVYLQAPVSSKPQPNACPNKQKHISTSFQLRESVITEGSDTLASAEMRLPYFEDMLSGYPIQ